MFLSLGTHVVPFLALPLHRFPWSSSTYVDYEKTQTVRVS